MAKKRQSITEKYKGLTFADASKKISEKHKDRNVNPLAMRSYEAEMQLLIKHQEAARLKEIAIKSLSSYRKPTNASEYGKGGALNYDGFDPLNPSMLLNPTGNYQDNRFIPQPQQGAIVPASSLYSNPFDSKPVAYQDNLSDGMPEIQPLPMPGLKPIQPMGEQAVPAARSTDDQVGGADKTGGNIYTPLIVGKGLEFLGKTAMLASGVDKVNPQYNPNEGRIESLMANRGIDTQVLENQALSQQNVALQNLNDVRSPNVRRALVNNIIQSTLKTLQQSSLQQDQINNQLAGEYASTLNNLGQQRVNATNYAEQLNSQGKANQELGIQNMLGSIGNIGQKVTDYKAGLASQELVTSFLSTADFKSGSAKDMIHKMERGESLSNSDIIKLANDNGKTVEETKEWLGQWDTYKKSLYGK